MNPCNSISADVKLGENVQLSKFINLYGCEIGADTKIGAFVEIQKNARVGKHCKISSHTFICEGVTVEDNVFIGHGVMFINDTYPRATTAGGALQTEADWKVEQTLVGKGASIGSNATILAKRRSAKMQSSARAASSPKTCRANAIVAGNPAKILRFIQEPNESKDDEAIPFLDLITPHLELEARTCRGISAGALALRDSSAAPWSTVRRGIRPLLQLQPRRSCQQRHRRVTLCHHGVRNRAWRRGSDGAQYLHRDRGSDFPVPRDSGVYRCRRADL